MYDYAYALNDPINGADANGHSYEDSYDSITDGRGAGEGSHDSSGAGDKPQASNATKLSECPGCKKVAGGIGPLGSAQPVITNGSSVLTGKGYINERFDPETGLIYLHARYQDPNLGSYLSPDTWDPDQDGVDIN